MEGRSVIALSTISGIVVADREKYSKGPLPNALECHICFKPPTDPVATSCGHVFCWPCVFSLVENKRKRKPCPVCGTFLTRDMNILPLYCGGAQEVLRAYLVNAVLPPRPSNPQMFMPQFARIKGSLDKNGSYLDTPISMRLLGHIEQEINNERARNERMVIELNREEDQTIKDNVRSELVRRERKLMREKSQMVLDIARLEGQLAHATQWLPNWWSDLTIEDEVLLHNAPSPSNHI